MAEVLSVYLPSLSRKNWVFNMATQHFKIKKYQYENHIWFKLKHLNTGPKTGELNFTLDRAEELVKVLEKAIRSVRREPRQIIV